MHHVLVWERGPIGSPPVALADLAVVQSDLDVRLFHAVADPERGGPTVCGRMIEGKMEPLMDRRLCKLCRAKLNAVGRLLR